MDEEIGNIVAFPLQEGEKAFVNHGSLRIIIIAKSREENRALMASLFAAMSEWFAANAHSLAEAPVLDGDTFEIVTESIQSTIPDTVPEEWSE